MTPTKNKLKKKPLQNTIDTSDLIKKNQLFNTNYNSLSNSNDMEKYLRESRRFQRICRNTMTHIHKTKSLDIINGSDFNQCMCSLEKINDKICCLISRIDGFNNELFTLEDITKKILESLQEINNDLSLLFRTYGTLNMTDLLTVCLGSQYITKLYEEERNSKSHKLQQIIECVHPTSYKAITWKQENSKTMIETQLRTKPKTKADLNINITTNNDENNTSSTSTDVRSNALRRNRIVEDTSIVEYAETLDCFDLARCCKDFQQRVYGIKIAFQHPEHKKTLIINGMIDDIPLWTFDSTDSILIKIEQEIRHLHNPRDIDLEPLNGFVSCLTLKDILIYSIDELSQRFVGHVSQAKRLHRSPLANLVNEFIEADSYTQRSLLLQLLTMSHKPEYQYTAYLLFDLLSPETGNVVDTHDQKTLFDSLPTKAKQFFKDALKRTVQYTNTLGNFDINKIPLEQQICLMKVDDNVKEKAMLKLKEVKNKSEDSGTKARQYLEALLKIPFGVYREEPVLTIMHKSRASFNEMMTRIFESPIAELIQDIPKKDEYTGIEIATYSSKLKKSFIEHRASRAKTLITTYINERETREELFDFITQLNIFIRERQKPSIESPRTRKIPKSGRNIQQMFESITDFIDSIDTNSNYIVELADFLGLTREPVSGSSFFSVIQNYISDIDKQHTDIKKHITYVEETLTKAVHGHTKAKRQIERIVGQWINGEQSGYCFGFEGPPGVGKTSLAKKGIAKCLIDNDGTHRPFTFIAIGGASNGSTLEGHNYTYVASTWGRIVDVLMEKKCMNPIIFIDELDKVSKTEHGREIIGILTHLIDPTQNDTFQDKYFHGVDIDLSKALFVFSYNDVDAIDRILLDRIHRIKFNALTLDDKLIITKDYLLPEVFEKMGLKGVIDIPEDVITFIIEKYTNEPGVRKLRELLFEIVGEVNITVLRGEKTYVLPVLISVDDIKDKYLHDRDMVRPYKITRDVATVGVINGLYANTIGRGGVLPIEVSFLPSSQLLELHLTGMQGDVMKESMQVARTLAFELAGNGLNECLKEVDDKIYKRGLHIHVPEGATKKDGPSAGTAITIAIFSRITGLPIRHTIAITGEICLSGCVTAIGGLEEKVLGGIKAGVKHFLFPKENEKDYEKIKNTYGGKGILDHVEFTSIDNIHQALSLAIDLP